MIAGNPIEHGANPVVVIAGGPDGDGLVDYLSRRYADRRIVRVDSYLAGIAETARRAAGAVVARVDPAHPRLRQAVSGLRAAAGDAGKVVLCCAPEMEPMTRGLMDCGADDYLIFPLVDRECDRALGIGSLDRFAAAAPGGAPVASMAELEMLGEALAGLDRSPGELLGRLAALVREALNARAVRIVVDGSVGCAGEDVDQPVLVEDIEREGRAVGRIAVGAGALGPYHAGDVRKLQHYARLTGHVAAAAAGQRRWRELSMTDELSGLPNRRFLLDFLSRAINRARGDRSCVTILLFDIDDFKKYNDEFGHDAGDEIIREAGRLFRHQCRESDVVTRLGGDEFAVVFWDAELPRVAGSKHPEDPLAVLDRFRAALKEHEFTKLGRRASGHLTVSAGMATFPWDASSAEDLIRRADECLLRAKRAGKNRIVLVGGEDR